MSEHVHVSDLRWDRLLAGELDAATKTEVLAAAGACETCAARHAELVRERDAFAGRSFAKARSRRWLAAPAILAAAAAVMLVVRRGDDHGGERVKGTGPSLVVEAGAPGQLALVASGDRVLPGDQVQASYSAKRAGFGAVLGKTGTDRASAYVPSAGDALVALPAGEQRAFPESTVLDDAAGDEVLVVVWCETVQPISPLLAELDGRGDIAERSGCWHRRLVLAKGGR